MPKFYVQTGEIKVVLNAEDPWSAAIKAIDQAGEFQGMGELTQVTEHGFCETPEDCRDEDDWFETRKILSELGLCD